MERVGDSSSVRLILYAMKQDVFLNPYDVVHLLSTVNADYLTMYLKEVIDSSTAPYGEF